VEKTAHHFFITICAASGSGGMEVSVKNENAYDFRKRLLTVHESGVRDHNRKASTDEFQLPEEVLISISPVAEEVLQIAAEDFSDFLEVSMDISAKVVTEDKGTVKVAIAEENGIDLKEFAVYRGFMIKTTSEGICVYGHDARGAAQALFYIEDIMCFKKAPVFPTGVIFKKPAFSPQIVHSGYGENIYPDAYLMRVAHEGRDAIIFNILGKGESEFQEANDLICRAGRYGIDVYAYSEILSRMSPEAPEAEEYYDGIYGKLFEKCPGLKGIVFVGESIEFPSRDPHVGGGYRQELTVDGIPCGKPSSGWFPCEDYPIWLNVVKNAIYKHQPKADILFWTYNWGYQPEDARIRLIENLPTDVTLLVTFEMFHLVQYENSVGFCCDYTLTFEGPSNCFKSEAAAAKKRGLKLYAMTNTGGLTWDLGTIPYQPMPYQWMRRYEAMFKAKKDWNLCGIMESHHYGFYPSFISKLSKLCFFEPRESMESILKTILVSEFGQENYQAVNEAVSCFSEAIRHVTPSNADQYGAMRIGPSYPFNLSDTINVQPTPGEKPVSGFVFPRYYNYSEPNQTPLSVRIHDEIRSMKKAVSFMEQGMSHFEKAKDLNEKLLRLKNLCQFILNSTRTGLRAKEWHVLICRMNIEPTKDGLKKIYDEMETLLLAEIKNAEDTIPLVEQDSRLGWEPCMLYMTDRWHLEWKIRQVRHVLDHDLAEYRRCVQL